MERPLPIRTAAPLRSTFQSIVRRRASAKGLDRCRTCRRSRLSCRVNCRALARFARAVRQTLPTVDFSGPEPLLEVVLADLDIQPTLTGFCAGFEGGRWRAVELARHLFEWLPP